MSRRLILLHGPLTWSGRTRFIARARSWSRLVTVGQVSMVNSGSSIVDRVGLDARPLGEPVKVLPLGRMTGPFVSFADDIVVGNRWGVTTSSGGVSGVDPRCESGACLALGPTSTQSPRAGRAGVLPRGGSSVVKVRWRILADGQFALNSVNAMFAVATPGGAEIRSQLSSALVMLPAPIDGLPLGTAWVTSNAWVPGTSPEVGVAVGLVRASVTDVRVGEAKVKLLVEWVQAE